MTKFPELSTIVTYEIIRSHIYASEFTSILNNLFERQGNQCYAKNWFVNYMVTLRTRNSVKSDSYNTSDEE